MGTTDNSDGRQGFSKRLRQAAKDAGYPDHGAAAAIARELKITPKAVGKWFNAEAMPDTKRLDALAGLLRTTVEHLLTGKRPPTPEPVLSTSTHPVGALVPVVAMPTLDVVSLREDAIPAEMVESRRLCPVEHGPRTYAFRQQGDAMTSPHPHAKSYPEGCLVFVDPDVTASPGQAVIAALDGGGVAFRILVREAGREWLRPINPAYPPIMEGFRVVGTVIGKWEDG